MEFCVKDVERFVALLFSTHSTTSCRLLSITAKNKFLCAFSTSTFRKLSHNSVNQNRPTGCVIITIRLVYKLAYSMLCDILEITVLECPMFDGRGSADSRIHTTLLMDVTCDRTDFLLSQYIGSLLIAPCSKEVICSRSRI